jgi:hypothetical protein
VNTQKPIPPAKPGESCPHPRHRVNAQVLRLEDSGCWTADLRITCDACQEPFRFVGLPAGWSIEKPMVSIDGLELRAPIEPQGAPRLFSEATFVMPPLPVKKGEES